MKSFRNKKKTIPTRYVLFTLSIVCIAAILLSLTLNITGGPLNTVAGYILVPMQQGINNLGKNISSRANDFRTLSEVLEENAALKQQNDDLTTQLNTIKLERYELENYRELLELDEKYNYEKVAANVIAKDSGNWFCSFTIDKGTNDGLSVGMNVIAGSGLVGIIMDVGPNFAKVRSIIDDSSNVSAMVTTTQDNFNVSGNLETMSSSGMITFSELRDTDDKVAIGDPVVTSYVSDQYQQGILIGYISSIEPNSNNLTKSGTITPVVDFEHIQEVLVILDIKNTGYTSED
jgi:rod shape-determining protein MreC